MAKLTSRARLNRRAAAGAAAAAVLALAACTSSSTSSGSAAAPASSGSAGAAASAASSGSGLAAGAPIVVGGIGSVQLAGEAGMDQGFEARIDRANADGGVAGHKIQFTKLYDDAGSTATDLSDEQTLILQQGAFAVAPVASVSFDPGTMSYLAAHHTPMLGYAFTPVSCGQDWFFPVLVSGCSTAAASVGSNESPWWLSAYLKTTGKSASSVKSAVVVTNSTANASETPAIEQSAKQLGSDVVYASDSIPQVPPANYTPYAQEIMNTKPNLVFVGIVYAEEVGLIQALKAAGYTGDIVSISGVAPDVFSASPSAAEALDGTYQGSPFPVAGDNTAASQQEVKDLKAIGDYDGGFSFGQSVGYWTADEFVSMLEATAKSGALTQQRFEQIVNSGSYTYTGPAGYYTQTWPASHTESTASCGSFSVLDDSSKTMVVKAPFQCYPLVKITAIPKMIP
jgi:branched-chain amino acid transport system substrate-binding protein